MTNSKLLTLLKHLFVVTVILSVTSIQSLEAECDICDPIACCTEAGDGAFVADPLDCFNYYVCINNASGYTMPSDQSIYCGKGNYYDNVLGKCVKGTDCLIPCANRNCRTFCAGDFQTVAYPNDCNKYYVCIPGQFDNPALTNCSDPILKYFNGVSCTSNPYQCCDLCTPYCPAANVEVIDPSDCERYYLCLDADTKPSEDYRFTCATGQYFSPVNGVCQSYTAGEEQCDPIC